MGINQFHAKLNVPVYSIQYFVSAKFENSYKEKILKMSGKEVVE